MIVLSRSENLFEVEKMTKFSEMRYQRPDIDAIKKELGDLTAELTAAESFEDAKEAFLKKDRLERRLATAAILVSIRHSIDTRDEFYEAEERFFNENLPLVREFEDRWNVALLHSRFRKELSNECGEIIFKNLEISRKAFSPAIIPEMQKENDLVQEYEKLLAAARIPFEGKSFTIAQLAPFKQDSDDERRLNAWKAEGQWYKDNQAELDRLYDELVRVRHLMGTKLGDENFVRLGYYRMERNCFDREDVEKFRASVRKYLVPLADRIFREKAKRLGKTYPMSFADNVINFRSGEALPKGDADFIVDKFQSFFSGLSDETGRFFRMMRENELLSLLATEGKRGGGFCEDIPDYGVPFVFTNFSGTRDDVETLAHECGHAFAGWKNAGRIPRSVIWPTLEACEVHSMSMEFFLWPWAKELFEEDTDKFLFSHLSGALTFIPYGTMVDHFQHCVYENPEWAPKERHECWKKLLKIYMPWQRLDGEIPFYSEGEGWQRQHHIYSSPFYYIDYCLAQTVALEFLSRIREDLSDAWKTYLKFTEKGGSLTFLELLEKAGLNDPFDEDCLKEICEKAEESLSELSPEAFKKSS